MNKKIGAALLAIFSLGVYAQENPLGSIFSSLKKLANAPETVTPPSSATSSESQLSQTDEIVRQLASQSTGISCTPGTQQMVQKEITAASDKFQMGQYGMASAQAYVAATTIAYCVTQGGEKASITEKNTIGKALAFSAIANERAGLNPNHDPQSETAIRAKYSLTLLRLNPEANRELIGNVESSGIFPEKTPEVTTATDAKMSAFEAVTKFQKNQVAFDSQYYGKTIQLTGKILKIWGDAKLAVVTLEGLVKSDDNRGNQDSAVCKITNKQAMSTLMNTSQGDKVTVRGVLKRQPLVDTGVTLTDCRFAS